MLRLSNLVSPGELVMDQLYLDQMRDYLTVIHDEFAILYDVVGAEGFGMDIEYKVTAQDQYTKIMEAQIEGIVGQIPAVCLVI